jgi:hypothetical protein
VSLTAAGSRAYDALERRQAVWVNRLAARLDAEDLETAARVLDHLCRQLARTGDDDEGR